MLAPAFEALFDPEASGARLALLTKARGLWSALAKSVGLDLDRRGAIAVGAPSKVESWAEELIRLGVRPRVLRPSALHKLLPWLQQDLAGVVVRQDWRIEPVDALSALHAAARHADVRLARRAVVGWQRGRVALSGGEIVAADALVVATGASTSLAVEAHELAGLTPIKGHILAAKSPMLDGPVVRVAQGYICPSARGVLVGATMEIGRSDRRRDPAQIARLRTMAGDVAPALGTARFSVRVGVRAATPDGLPWVGASRREGVWLAVGARRNGWLLAPLIARSLARAIAGEAADEAGRAFDPRRLSGA